LLDFTGGGEDSAFELGMRLHGFRSDGDIGAVGGRFERDRKADAARAAGDEQGFAGKRHSSISSAISSRLEHIIANAPTLTTSFRSIGG
jgi:hypothetical protein